MILLDTHVIVWLYGGELSLIPQPVQQRLNQDQLAISPFVLLEIAYLFEIGRIRCSPEALLEELRPRLELSLSDISSGAVCRAATNLTWTRDPFDRLIAAHATVAGLALVTKDEIMRRHLPLAWWG